MQTPKDFDVLSDSIFEKTHQSISPTTLKRLWGYLQEPSIPRSSTLNLLAQYVGFDSWAAYCKEEKTPLQTTQTDTEQPEQRRHWRKTAIIGGALALLAVIAVSLLGFYYFGRASQTDTQKPYILKMGQRFSTPHEYLKLFGIIATDTLWGRPVPHYEKLLVWTPEYHNSHWHNYGDSAQMMPTITEHWEPDEYEASFMKGLVDSTYVFLGIYRMSLAQSDTTRCVWERIADQCDLTSLDYLEQLRN